MVGAIAGIVGVTASFPLDMIKTRLQSQKVAVDGELLRRRASLPRRAAPSRPCAAWVSPSGAALCQDLAPAWHNARTSH